MIIAIDGPSGAGKSTVAKAAARELGFSCLDTGAMYRAIAWYALEQGISLDEEDVLTHIAQTKQISFGHVAGEPLPREVYLDNDHITDAIREARIDKAVSSVSRVPGVREALVGQQQRIAAQGNYVIEGRDIGTVVFPHAELKIFLTASNEERARRRVEQNRIRGIGSTSFNEVYADLEERDQADKNRSTAPLRQADDAVLVDSTHASLEDIIATICSRARALL